MSALQNVIDAVGCSVFYSVFGTLGSQDSHERWKEIFFSDNVVKEESTSNRTTLGDHSASKICDLSDILFIG